MNHVERHALRCGFAVERVWHDYGLDLMVFTYTTRGAPENGNFWIQLKATDALHRSQDGRTVIVRVERAHLLHWLNEPFPVFLIVYDARKDVAYWLYVQQDAGQGRVFTLRKDGRTVSLHIPIENLVSDKALGQFARFKNDRVTGLGR